MTRDQERRAFLDKLAEDFDDPLTHQVFADWLEELGDDEGDDDLAVWHRQWTTQALAERRESEGWLQNYCAQFGWIVEGYEELTVGRLVEVATNCLKGKGDDKIYLNFDTPDFVYEQRTEFWMHYDRYTGRRVPEGEGRTFFRCSC